VSFEINLRALLLLRLCVDPCPTTRSRRFYMSHDYEMAD